MQSKGRVVAPRTLVERVDEKRNLYNWELCIGVAMESFA